MKAVLKYSIILNFRYYWSFNKRKIWNPFLDIMYNFSIATYSLFCKESKIGSLICVINKEDYEWLLGERIVDFITFNC